MGADAIVIEGRRRAAISARSRPACWRRRFCRTCPRCRSSSPAASAAARRSLAYLEMGAAGVQLGTRFVCAHESIAHPRFKQAFIRAGARDAVPSVAARSALSGDPGARARQCRRPSGFSRVQRDVIDRFSARRAVAKGSAARDRAFLGRRAAPRGDRRRCRDRLADGRAERRPGDTRAERPREILDELVAQAVAALGRGRASPGLSAANERSRRNASGGIPRRASSCAGCATSWRARARRRSGSTASSASSPPRWSPRCARPTSCARARCWSCSRPKGCGPKRCTAPGCASARAWSASSPRPRGRWRSPTRRRIPISPTGPETGEEIYHSLMGVPILRGGRVLGVLVVQNRTLRHYAEDEIEIAADDRDDRRRAGRQRRARQSAGNRPGAGGGDAAGAARRDPAQCRPGDRSRRCCTSRAS